MEGLNLQRIEKMIVVKDDWYPCYDVNKVKLSLFIQYDKKLNYHFVRICVWGADDFGLEMDYENMDLHCLIKKYNEWKENIFDKVFDGIDKDWFYKFGFYNA